MRLTRPMSDDTMDRRDELERDVRARLERHRDKLGHDVFERTISDIVRITLKYEQTATPTAQERERHRAALREQAAASFVRSLQR